MDKRLRIILELVASGFNAGARGAGNIFKGFIGGIVNGAASAGKALMSMAQSVFFVREAINTLARAGRWLFDTFVKGAGDAAKMEAKLKNLTGSAENASRVMDMLRRTAADTGANFDELAAGATLLVSAAKDASGAFDIQKFEELNKRLTILSALRPDVPIDRLARGVLAWIQGEYRSLEMFLDQPLRDLAGIEDKAKDLEDLPKEISRGVTSIALGISETASDAEENLDALDKALEKLGATSQLIEDVAEKSGLERFLQLLDQIAATVGKPVFEVLNEELSELADWLQENPEKVQAFAEALGGALANNLEAVIKALSQADWEAIGDGVIKLAEGFEKLSEHADKVIKAVELLPALFPSQAAVERPEEMTGRLEEAGVGGGLSKLITDVNRATAQQPGLSDFISWITGGRAAGGAGGGQQRVVVEVDLKSDMLDARIKQGADRSVTDGLNAVTEELGGPQ